MATEQSTVARLREESAKFHAALVAPNTRRGYGYDWLAFERWAKRLGLAPCPAASETLALYATWRLDAGRKVSTVTRQLAAVARHHRDRGLADPFTAEVRDLLRGARRLRPDAVRQVLPLSLAELRVLALHLRDGKWITVRNRAMLLVGFASALRSAELVALTVADLEFTVSGAVLHIRREKQCQEGSGRIVGVPYGQHAETCPVRALTEWLERRGAAPGPLFTRRGGLPLAPGRVRKILKQSLERAGKSAADYGSHSLRSGFITAAGENGASELLIASHTGHRDLRVLRRYFRRRDVFRSNPCSYLDL